MGKRSSRKFERREADLYPTVPKAIPSLIPHVADITEYAEPCCGPHKKLIELLDPHGLQCSHASDLCFGQDALALGPLAYPVITNPPHGRETMHALITHFLRIAPFSWLLIDYDWSATRQAAPYLPNCSDIAIIGRLRWIEGSKHHGVDNYAWYKFTSTHTSGPVLHGLGVR